MFKTLVLEDTSNKIKSLDIITNTDYKVILGSLEARELVLVSILNYYKGLRQHELNVHSYDMLEVYEGMITDTINEIHRINEIKKKLASINEL